jgi:hypothetical protein
MGVSVATREQSRFYHVGVTLLLLGEDSATRRWLTEAERRFPADGRIQTLLALLDAMHGNVPDALFRGRKRLKKHPTDDLSLVSELTYIAGSPDG